MKESCKQSTYIDAHVKDLRRLPSRLLGFKKTGCYLMMHLHNNIYTQIYIFTKSKLLSSGSFFIQDLVMISKKSNWNFSTERCEHYTFRMNFNQIWLNLCRSLRFDWRIKWRTNLFIWLRLILKLISFHAYISNLSWNKVCWYDCDNHYLYFINEFHICSIKIIYSNVNFLCLNLLI